MATDKGGRQFAHKKADKKHIFYIRILRWNDFAAGTEQQVACVVFDARVPRHER